MRPLIHHDCPCQCDSLAFLTLPLDSSLANDGIVSVGPPSRSLSATEAITHDRVSPWRPRPKLTPPKTKAASGVLGSLGRRVRVDRGNVALGRSFQPARFPRPPTDPRAIAINEVSSEPLLSSGVRILIDVRQRIPVTSGSVQKTASADGVGRVRVAKQ